MDFFLRKSVEIMHLIIDTNLPPTSSTNIYEGIIPLVETIIKD